MTFRPKTGLALLALPLLLAACGTTASVAPAAGTASASTSAAAPAGSPTTTPSPTMSGMQMHDGMSMAPGQTMPAGAAAATAAGPPDTASMVCGPEIQGSIKTLLALPGLPTGTSTWRDGLFTCTYPLSQGRLVLSVKQSTNDVTAKSYYTALRDRTQQTTPLTGLTGLGLPAFQSAVGVVSFVKDNLTLVVDATGLVKTVGPHRTSRGDFAYTVATDVLACWQE